MFGIQSMKNKIFIKEDFLYDSDDSLNLLIKTEGVSGALEIYKKQYLNTYASVGIFNNIVNRSEYIKEACGFLNSGKQKLFLISGFQGSGKTELINTLAFALEENILNFYYECSSGTNLDDVILSLFGFLKKMSSISPEYKRSFKISGSQSIDERLINSIKNLNRPLLIIIDGFENLINDNFDVEHKELMHFLKFMSSLPEIKIIISGRKVNFYDFKNYENISEIKLGALEEQEAYKLLKDNGLIETESVLKQIFQITRGYPENILWFLNTVNNQQISSFDLMQEYYSESSKSFEEFIYQKLFESIENDFSKIIYFFASIRHSLSLETVEKLNFTDNISEKINYLSLKMILTQNRGNFYIKSLVKNVIYSNMTAEEKKQIHRYLYELYSEQISKKLEDRFFYISRKLLYSEQYYHYMCLINLGDKSLADLKTTTLSALKPDYKYLYTNIADSLFVGSKETASVPVEIAENHEVKKFAENILPKKIYRASDNVLDFKIELTEEEKKLLAEENIADESEKVISLQEVFPLKIQKEQNLTKNNIEDEKTDKIFKKLTGLEEKAANLKLEGNVLFKERKFDRAIEKFKEALILYENMRDSKNINDTLALIANACNECFRHDIALTYYYKILNSKEIVESEHKIAALCGIGDILDYREDYENAVKFYQKALEEAESAGNISQKANVSFKKALAYDDLGNSSKALEFYLKNTSISQDVEINPYIAASYANIAAIYEEREDAGKAKKYYSESLKFDKIMNNREGQYETLSKLGNIHFEMNQCQIANEYFHRAISIARKINDSYKIAMSCLDIGDIYLSEKHYEKALKAFITAGKTIEKTISTDSREKIDRRFKKVINEIGEHNFKQIIEKLKKKHE